jgi:excisionase family DNA binding protein
MAKKPGPDELRQRIAVSPAEAAIMLGVDRSTFYRHLMPKVLTGKIKSLRIGAARRIIVASLLAWVEAEAARDAA